MVTLNYSYEQIVAGLKKQGEQYAKYRSRMIEGQRGPWSIKKFTVEINLQNLRMVRDGRGCSPGTFTKLCHVNRGVVMSDTDAEIEDFLPIIQCATGRILVAGLGLGLVTQCLLDKPEIEHVTVLEIDEMVIDLVGSQIVDPRLTIKHHDVFDWKPDEKFDYGWYDIWEDICGDNLEEITKLKRKFARKVNKQLAWCEIECKRMA